MAEPLTGGCCCGVVRYSVLSAPFDCGWCHCRTCQLNSAAPAMVFATVPAPDLVFTQGADAVMMFESSHFGRRRFCGRCGTTVTMEVVHQPETVDFTVATLDDPARIEPGFHIFWSSRIAWFDPGDTRPRHEKFRPESRGLDGEGPPPLP
jgi:hypothetical protein